jgi:hypothetical protein
MRDLIRNSFERIYGRTPTEEELNSVLLQNRERNYPKVKKPLSRDRQMLYGLGMTGLGSLGGAYAGEIGKDLAKQGISETYKDSWLKGGVDYVKDLFTGGDDTLASYIPSISATDVAPAIVEDSLLKKGTDYLVDNYEFSPFAKSIGNFAGDLYQDSLVENLFDYLFY